MNHEFWNEIGNLYFVCGAYEPAIHAYLQSIKLDNTFGRPYSNLAMTYVQTGRYRDAINLYLRGIELLVDEKEKAATWNKLGLLYRQIKEYDLALEAYQHADLIAPQNQDEAGVDVRKPLTVSMPNINMASILAKGNVTARQTQADLVTKINAEFATAETMQFGTQVVAEEVLPLDFENFSDDLFKPQAGAHSDWKLIYADAPSPIVPQPEAVVEEVKAVAAEVDEPVSEIIVPIDMELPVEIHDLPIERSEPDPEPAPVFEETPLLELIEIPKPAALDEEETSVAFVEVIDPVVIAAEDTSAVFVDAPEPIINETDIEATQYSQTEYILNDLSPEERTNLEMNIIKYQHETAKNPRSFILWVSLGEAYKSFGRYKDAIQAFQTAIQLNPVNPNNHYLLGLVYAAEKKHHEAVKAFEKVLEIDHSNSQAHASLASQYRLLGMEDSAQMHIEKARSLQPEEETDYNRACLEALCGNNERAFELLTVALETKQTYVNWVRNDPDFDGLRNDNRFKTLLMNFAAAVA